MTEPYISFRNVSKAFGSLVVLDGLDLDIEEGSVTTIIGRSGIGKSVLLKHIVGLLDPDGGDILHRGVSLASMRAAQRREMRSELSYLFQNLALFDSMTVSENIGLPLSEKTKLSKAEIHERVMAKIALLDIGAVADKYPSQVSGGMAKRVGLARALITEPQTVLFDEPTTGLDPVRKKTVHDMIERYQQEFGFTAVIVSHDIPSVFSISQKVAMLDAGKIVFEGTPNEILACEMGTVREFVQSEEE